MEELITIVVPVYNVEKYIDRCLKSLLNQTYNNLEIILVDDGSKDNSGKICDQYVKKDKRIKVVHKKNGGLSDARNAGLEVTKGKYVSFVDSDDWISDDAIEVLYKYLISENADIVCGDMQKTFSDEAKNQKTKDIEYKVFNNVDALENMLYLHGTTNSACGKLYKTELFKNVRFPVGKLYEDLGTIYKVYSKSKKCVLIDHIVYYYFQNQSSIMHSKYSSRRLEGISFAKDICEFLSKKHHSIINSGKFRLYYECLMVLNDMPYFSKDGKQVRQIMKEYRDSVLKDKKLYKKQKLLCFASLFGHFPIKVAFYFKNKLKDKRGKI